MIASGGLAARYGMSKQFETQAGKSAVRKIMQLDDRNGRKHQVYHVGKRLGNVRS